MGISLTSPKLQFFDTNGDPLVGGFLYTKVAGGGANKTTYTTPALSAQNTNPIVLNSRGEAGIYAASGEVFWLSLTDSQGVTIWTEDNVQMSLTASNVGQQLVLTSAQGASPYANTFVQFNEPDGTLKGYIGYTSTTDNTFAITSYEDFRIKFRTGKPGDTTNFVNRGFVYGSATASWIGVSAPAGSVTGGCTVRFTTDDAAVTKGVVGYNSTSDDDLDIANQVSGGHIELATTGTGRIRVPLASGTIAAPMLAITGDTDTGLHSVGANSVSVVTNGAVRLTVDDTATSSVGPFRAVLGTAQIKYSFSDTLGSGMSNESSGNVLMMTNDLVRLTINQTGSVRFNALAVAPAAPTDGDVYYDSALVKLRVRAGGAWVDLH